MGRKLQPKQVKGQDGGHEVNVWQSQAEKEALTLGRWWSYHWKKPIFSTKTKLMKNREISVRIQVFLGLVHIIMEAEKSHFRLSGDPGTLLVSLLWAQRPGTEETWCQGSSPKQTHSSSLTGLPHPQCLLFISEHLLSSPVPRLSPPLPYPGSVFVSLLLLFLEFSKGFLLNHPH